MPRLHVVIRLDPASPADLKKMLDDLARTLPAEMECGALGFQPDFHVSNLTGAIGGTVETITLN